MGERRVERPAPQRGAVADADERHVDAQSIARALQRTVEDGIDLKLASGLERVGIGRRIPSHGARGPDSDPFNLSNPRDDGVGETETDVGVAAALRERLQRQHRQRTDRRRAGAGLAPKAQPRDQADENDDGRSRGHDSPATLFRDARRGLRPLPCDLADIDHQVAHRLVAIRRVLLERLLDDGTKEHWNVLGQRRSGIVRDGVENDNGRGTLERTAAGQELVQHHAEGEDVTARIKALPRRLLRRHIGQRADDDSCLGLQLSHGRRIAVAVFFRQGRQPKVGKLRVAARRDENVLRFDVAMKDAGLVRGRKAVGHACQQIRDLPPCRTRRRHPGVESPGIHNLGDEVRMSIRLASLVDGHDVRIIQRRGGERLPFEAMARHRVGDLTREDFDGDRALQARVPSLVHLSHAARAEHRDNFVRANSRARGETHL